MHRKTFLQACHASRALTHSHSLTISRPALIPVQTPLPALLSVQPPPNPIIISSRQSLCLLHSQAHTGTACLPDDVTRGLSQSIAGQNEIPSKSQFNCQFHSELYNRLCLDIRRAQRAPRPPPPPSPRPHHHRCRLVSISRISARACHVCGRGVRCGPGPAAERAPAARKPSTAEAAVAAAAAAAGGVPVTKEPAKVWQSGDHEKRRKLHHVSCFSLPPHDIDCNTSKSAGSPPGNTLTASRSSRTQTDEQTDAFTAALALPVPDTASRTHTYTHPLVPRVVAVLIPSTFIAFVCPLPLPAARSRHSSPSHNSSSSRGGGGGR